MKIKTTLSITSFAATFAIGLIIFTFSTFSFFTKFFQKDIDSATKAKIYSVLQQDRQNRKVKIKKITTRKEGDHITFLNAIIDYSEATANIDAIGASEDFQIAWKEYVTTQTEYANLLNQLEDKPFLGKLSKVEAEIFERKISEEKIAWNNLLSITKSYGFKFDNNEYLINELQDK